MDLIMSICPKIYVMNFGAQLAVGTPEEVQSNTEVLKAYLGEDYVNA
jgi:branched-chain amino acid transport system ATP-binding protein